MLFFLYILMIHLLLLQLDDFSGQMEMPHRLPLILHLVREAPCNNELAKVLPKRISLKCPVRSIPANAQPDLHTEDLSERFPAMCAPYIPHNAHQVAHILPRNLLHERKTHLPLLELSIPDVFHSIGLTLHIVALMP